MVAEGAITRHPCPLLMAELYIFEDPYIIIGMKIAEMTMVEMTAPPSSKVGSMGVSLFEGPTPVESFLFSKLDRWSCSWRPRQG